MGKMFFNILATFAEFEVDLLRMRTREGMAFAKAKGKLRGKQPKLSHKQQTELSRMHATGDCSINDLAELFPSAGPPCTAPCRKILPQPCPAGYCALLLCPLGQLREAKAELPCGSP